jgi:hypothetical protein
MIVLRDMGEGRQQCKRPMPIRDALRYLLILVRPVVNANDIAFQTSAASILYKIDLRSI